MFSRRRLGLLLAGVALILVGMAVTWRVWAPTPSQPGQARRVAILPIDNQTGDPRLNWAGEAIRQAAILELGKGAVQGDQPSVILARDAGDAAARQATHLVYGQLEPEWAGPSGMGPAAHPGWVTYSFSIEDSQRHAVLRRVRNSGPVLKSTVALATLVAPETGGPSRLAPGVNNDQALEFLSTGKFAECAAADPQAIWCWERWANSAFEAGKKDEALTVLARAREQGTQLSAASKSRLDLIEASIRGDESLRMAALEKLVQADSSNLAAVAELASALMANQRFVQAEALYRKSLERNSNQPEAWNLLAYAQAGQSRFDEARKSLAEYDRLAHASPNPPDSRGEIEWMAGDLASAATWFQESYRRGAQFNAGVALEKAALSRYLAGDASGAAELANKFLADREQAGDALANFHRARWQFLWGNNAGARALLERLVQRGGPDAAVAAMRLMLADLRDNNIDGAKKWARAVKDLAPKTGSQILSRMATALSEGDSSAVSDPALRAELAAIHLTLSGEFARAVGAWDEAIRTPHGSGDSFARELKAWCLLRAGKTSEASSELKGAWPLLDPDERLLFDFLIYPNLLFVRAEAVAARGNTVEARRLYDLYLRYAGPSKDRFGQADKARGASRL